MEKGIYAGRVSNLEQKIGQNGKPYLTFSVVRKAVWIDKQTNSWKSQVLSKNFITGAEKHIQYYQAGILKDNAYVYIEGTPKLETYLKDNQTKASLKYDIINLEVLSTIELPW